MSIGASVLLDCTNSKKFLGRQTSTIQKKRPMARYEIMWYYSDLSHLCWLSGICLRWFSSMPVVWRFDDHIIFKQSTWGTNLTTEKQTSKKQHGFKLDYLFFLIKSTCFVDPWNDDEGKQRRAGTGREMFCTYFPLSNSRPAMGRNDCPYSADLCFCGVPGTNVVRNTLLVVLRRMALQSIPFPLIWQWTYQGRGTVWGYQIRGARTAKCNIKA